MLGGVLVSLADTAVVMAIKSVVTPGTHFATIAMQNGCRQVVVRYPCVGEAADLCAAARPALQACGIPLVRVMRTWDSRLFPHLSVK